MKEDTIKEQAEIYEQQSINLSANAMSFSDGAKWALDNQWISVDDYLPKHNQRVIFAIYGAFDSDRFYGVYTGLYSDKNGFSDLIGNYGKNGGNVEYWMPIPKIKEEEK